MQESKATLKVPGGKLLKVKILHENNVIKKFNLYGDFFLHPEDKIVEIENALQKTPLNSYQEMDKKLTNTIQHNQIQLLGITKEAIIQAIAQATASWRLIPLTTNSAAINMAIDEAILNKVAANDSPPTIRFYQWQPSAVSIGCFQSMEEEIDTEVAKNKSVECVRRITGGGAVYHDFEGEITYSIIAPEALLPKDITESYHVICGWIISALSKLGISAAFHPINDIITNKKKISGNAQTRRKGVVLQHGTILYKVDVEKMFSLLKVPSEKIRDKMIAKVKERVTSIVHQNQNISKQQVYQALVQAFSEGKTIQEAPLTEGEAQDAKIIAQEKYGAQNWNFSR